MFSNFKSIFWERRLCVLMILFAIALSGYLKDPNDLEDTPPIFSIGGMVIKSDFRRFGSYL